MAKKCAIKFAEAKCSLRTFLYGTVFKTRMLIADAELWMAYHPDEPPVDLGGDLVVIRLCERMLALVEADERLPPQMLVRLQEQLFRNANRG